MIFELSKEDEEYQEAEKRLSEFEIDYMRIKKTFSKEVLEVIENYIDALNKCSSNHADLAYLAGIQSGIWIEETRQKLERYTIDEKDY